MWRKVLALALALTAIAVAAAVAWRAWESRNALTVACLLDSEAEAVERNAVAPYVRAHPGARVRVVHLFDSGQLPADIDATMTRRVARKLRNGADVFVGLEAAYVRELVKSGAVECLDARLSTDPGLASCTAAPVDSILRAEGGGRVYALAPSFASMALAYNKDMFDSAGVPYPAGNLTWEEAFNLGERVAGRISTQTAAFCFGPPSLVDFASTVTETAPSGGVYVIDGDRVKPETDFAHTWDYLADARRTHARAKDGCAFWRGQAPLGLVYNGEVDDPSTFQSDPTFRRFRWDIAPAPVFNRVTNLSYAHVSSAMVMSASSRRKNDAWELMSYLAGPEYGALLGAMREQPWSGSLPACDTSGTMRALGERADRDYSAFYAHAAPRARGIAHKAYGSTYMSFLLQRLMVDTLDGKIDGAGAARILAERGQAVYDSTQTVDPSTPDGYRTLIGY